MLTFDSVRLRLEREQPLTFLEFNYMVMQAYDFLELARRYDCRLQMGGSDQWGNIVNGVELGRRVEGRELFGLTTPLITTSAGAKMGKTAAGCGLAERGRACRPSTTGSTGATSTMPTSAVFCGCSPSCRWTRSSGSRRLQGAELNEAKKILADEATRLCRGEAAAVAAAETARASFSSGRRRTSARGADLTRQPWSRSRARSSTRGVSVVELFRRSGLVASNGEARRLIRGGGARLNERRSRTRRWWSALDDLSERPAAAVRRQEAPRLGARRSSRPPQLSPAGSPAPAVRACRP